MAKCPKCSTRKGKRPCPALRTEICSSCCGEHRLRDIDCPEHCQFLGSEGYHRQRRWERSRSMGRSLLEPLQREFSSEPTWSFVFRLLVEIYAFSCNRSLEARGLDDGRILDALKVLRGRLGTIYVPGSAPSPLGEFLHERCESAQELGTSREFPAAEREKVLVRLENFVERLTAKTPGDFLNGLTNLLSPLDLKIDLGYDPEANQPQKPTPQSQYQQRSSGLIVPPSLR